MDFSVKNASKIFQKASIPTISSVFLDSFSTDEATATFRVRWKQDNHVTQQKKQFTTIHKYIESTHPFILSPSHKLKQQGTFPIIGDPEIILEALAPSKVQRAIVKKCTVDKKDVFVLEIWSSSGGLKKCINLSSFGVHGDIHSDICFSSLAWNKDEQKLLYVAEQKPPKTCGFFESSAGRSDNENVEIGTKYVYEESWGELLYQIKRPVMCVVDIVEESLHVFSHGVDEISPAQPQWGPNNTIVFSGMKSSPNRAGRIYCENRPSDIFLLTYDENFETIDTKNITQDLQRPASNWCPRVNKSYSSVLFIHSNLSTDGSPHRSDVELFMYDFSNQCLHKVPIEEPLFLFSFPESIWFDDDTSVAFLHICRGKTLVADVNVVTGKRKLNDRECALFFGVDNDYIMMSRSELNSTAESLVIEKFKPSAESNDLPESRLSLIDSGITLETVSVHEIDYIISWALLPNTLRTGKLPIIVWAHGGPHSVFSNIYNPFAAAFCKLGYAVLMVNYSGSIGFTRESLMSLPGKIGEKDVQEVQSIVLAFIEQNKNKIDMANIFYFGGSHGGFIGAHLMGQYPDFYRAAVLRNPVIEIASMAMATDIPDWSYVECGLKYSHGKVPNTEDYTVMLGKSPVIHVPKIKAPILICVGGKDARVPPSQGTGFYRILKGNYKTTKLLLYPNASHPLKSVDIVGDFFVNTCQWFEEHMQH